MYKFIRARKLGFEDGVSDAIYDIKNKRFKVLKKIDDKKILSDLYDLGYFEGYKGKYKYRFIRSKKDRK